MPLLPSKSTVISDMVLATSCLWALYSLHGTQPGGQKQRLPTDLGMASNNLATVWFALILVSSSIGAFRFCK